MKNILLLLLGGFLFMALVGVGSYLYEKASCRQRSVSFEDSRYGVFSKCMVKHNGKWLPLDNIRGFSDD